MNMSLLVPQPSVVVGKVHEGPGVVTLRVHPTEGELPTFAPGQVSMLGAFGVGEAAISISSDTDVDTHHDYTIRRAGSITNALVETPVGGTITVRGPFGEAWPFGTIRTRNLIIVAGGLGIAPLRAQISDAVAAKSRFDNLVILFGARSPDELIFGDDVERWRSSGATVRCTVDKPDPDWNGSVGLVTDLVKSTTGADGAGLDWSDTTAFVCGPDVMMRATAECLIDLGMDPNDVWLTLERNMQCGNALCGHCQLGPILVCRDGPVVNYPEIARFHSVAQM